jgi:hypothetical protein
MNGTFFRLALLGFCTAGIVAYAADSDPTTQATTEPTTQATQASTNPSVNWDEAKNHVGETVTVTGPVMGTHEIDAAHALVLNVGKDYPDKDRFTVFISGGDDTPEDVYSGKTVTVTGEVELYRDVPEIKASAKDVVVK